MTRRVSLSLIAITGLTLCCRLPGLVRADEPSAPAPLMLTVVPPGDEHEIDLSSALQLAEGQNPQIGLSRQAIQEALALQLQARGMMLPTARAGANYHDHEGILQTATGQLRQADISSLYFGNGVMALGSATPLIPGIQIFGHVGDGVFEPLAARQLVASRRFQAQATSNQMLLEVAGRFLELVRAEADLHAIRQSEKDVGDAVKITEAFARVNQGRDADARRAQTTADLLHADEEQAEEALLTASAELARLLSLPLSVRLRSVSPPGTLLELVDADRNLADLLAVASRSRPELAALAAEIARKRIQVRQERTRPFLPTISLGFSAGRFGGGTDRSDLVPVHPEFGRFGDRTDIDLIAYWTLKNMGAGNLALAKGRQAEMNVAVGEQDQMVNLVRREVAEAQARVQARNQDLRIAKARLGIAEQAFQEDLRRIRGNVGLPIELLNSVNRLTLARRDILRVVQQFNLAQMQLFVAMGQSPLAR